jgi:hypothetical protein
MNMYILTATTSFCPRYKEQDCVEIEGVKWTAREKLAWWIREKIADSTILVDPASMPSSPGLIGSLLRAQCQCKECGCVWTKKDEA